MFKSFTFKKHFLVALVLGFLLRLLSTYFVWGPQALDDYLDNLIPAWKYMMGIAPDLHDYRSPFFMWILGGWLKFGQLFGIENAISQVRWSGLLQSLVSLLALFAIYIWGRQAENKKTTTAGLYLVAAYGLMPFASTRLFLESFVMGFVTLGVVLLGISLRTFKTRAPKKGISADDLISLCGYGLIGFATLVRFQIGIIYVAWLAIALLQKNKRQFWLGFFFGFFLVGAEGIIDFQFGRKPFETMYSYYTFTKNPNNAPAMAWYNTWLTALGALFFPFSLLLWSGWKKVYAEYRNLIWAILAFLIFHSLMPHKEERYLYPVLPFLVWFLAAAWTSTTPHKSIRFFFSPLFIFVNCALLFIGCFVNTQVGLVGPLAEFQATSNEILYLDYDNINMRNFMAPFFVRKPARFINILNSPSYQEAMLNFEGQSNILSIAAISSRIDHAVAFAKMHTELSQKLKCGKMLSATSLSDKLLFYFRPDLNRRRMPTSYFRCER